VLVKRHVTERDINGALAENQIRDARANLRSARQSQ
jgi:hypothetical protein